MNKLLRISVIALTFIAITWFGLVNGPEHQSAEAKVFERIFSFTNNMPPYLFDDDATSKPRKVIVNGNTTWMTVTKTEDDIAEILRFYNEQYKDQPYFGVPEEATSKIADSKEREEVNKLNALFEEISQHKHFVLAREHYGFLGIIDFKDKDHHLNSEEFIDLLEEVSISGELSDIATGRVVIALKPKRQRTATVLNIWTGEDFSLKNLIKDSSGNTPGFDIEDVPVYHTDKRELSVEQDNPLSTYRVVQYIGEGSLPAHIIFMRNRMESNGWQVNKTFDEVTRNNNAENTMFYTRDNRECTIQVSRGEAPGIIRTTVIENTLKSG